MTQKKEITIYCNNHESLEGLKEKYEKSAISLAGKKTEIGS